MGDAPTYQPPQPGHRRRGPKAGTAQARRGGQALRDRKGVDFYREIGKRGGAATRNKHGLEGYADMGRQGGLTTRQRYGLEHYQRLGTLGGTKARDNRAERGRDATAPDA